eukprot:5685838-Alexandrium_andersonii.AAC.1
MEGDNDTDRSIEIVLDPFGKFGSGAVHPNTQGSKGIGMFVSDDIEGRHVVLPSLVHGNVGLDLPPSERDFGPGPEGLVDGLPEVSISAQRPGLSAHPTFAHRDELAEDSRAVGGDA